MTNRARYGKNHCAKSTTAIVKATIDTIGEFNVDDHKRRQFLELKMKVQELEKALDFFRM